MLLATLQQLSRSELLTAQALGGHERPSWCSSRGQSAAAASAEVNLPDLRMSAQAGSRSSACLGIRLSFVGLPMLPW